ncbi:prepilin-type N-terminal cleavage/methylation domain-containing protein [bacterium]|jgi:prepilin-type N-terminal cleavage/methylation domain-containing protein|nr:prepilin-type N-terminal cleavage/methylation domain-containing protein [bacterium]
MNRLIKQAFTLIELLVVIAIIGILSGLIVISMSGVTQKANIAKAQIFSNSLRNSLLLNLISEWKFDENSGTSIKDSWNGKDGTLVGATTLPIWKEGSDCIYGSCVEFDGSDDYTLVNTDAVFDADNFTFSLWVYNGASSLTYPTIIGRGISDSTGHYWIYTNGTNESNILWEFGNGTTFTHVSWASVLGLNVWQHLVFSYNQNNHTVELFVDGISKTKKTTTNSLKTIQNNLFIGSFRGISSTNFKGKLDNILFFNNEIPTSLIRQSYYLGLNQLLIKEIITEAEYSQRINKLAKFR